MIRPPYSAHERALGRASRLQRAVHTLRAEGDTRARESAAVGAGLLLGCMPFWGIHFFVCWAAGKLFKLNRIKLYLASNLINPLVLPPLLYAEVQAGALARRGETIPLSRDVFWTLSPWEFGIDLIVGSAIVGVILGALGAAVTFAARRPSRDPFFRALARRAADRYLEAGITPWEFARGKISGDPAYRHALGNELSGASGTLVDLGCGQGAMLALLAEARATAVAGQWEPSRPAPPAFTRLVGIETRPRVAQLAERALEGEAEVRRADIRDESLPPCDVVLLFDVLHMLPGSDHMTMLRAVHAALVPGGRLLMREADAAAGWSFQVVRIANRIKAIVTRNWRQAHAFRSADDWARLLQETGFDTTVTPMGHGTPFGNVLLVAVRR